MGKSPPRELFGWDATWTSRLGLLQARPLLLNCSYRGSAALEPTRYICEPHLLVQKLENIYLISAQDWVVCGTCVQMIYFSQTRLVLESPCPLYVWPHSSDQAQLPLSWRQVTDAVHLFATIRILHFTTNTVKAATTQTATRMPIRGLKCHVLKSAQFLRRAWHDV